MVVVTTAHPGRSSLVPTPTMFWWIMVWSFSVHSTAAWSARRVLILSPSHRHRSSFGLACVPTSPHCRQHLAASLVGKSNFQQLCSQRSRQQSLSTSALWLSSSPVLDPTPPSSPTANADVVPSTPPQSPGRQQKDPKAQWPGPTVVLRRSRQSKAFRDGNPLIFTRAIRELQPPPLEETAAASGTTTGAATISRPTTPERKARSHEAVPPSAGAASPSKSKLKATSSNPSSMVQPGGYSPRQGQVVQVVVEEGGEEEETDEEEASGRPLRRGGRDVSRPRVAQGATPARPQRRVVVLGWGVYNPDSLYRVRMLCHKLLQPTLAATLSQLSFHPTSTDSLDAGFDVKNDHELDGLDRAAIRAMVHHHLHHAIVARKALGLPNHETGTYRLLHGEGDGLSGLAMDVIGVGQLDSATYSASDAGEGAEKRDDLSEAPGLTSDVTVIMSSAAWCQIHQTVIEQVVRELRPYTELIWKTTASRLEQDGYRDDQTLESAFDQQEIIEDEGDDLPVTAVIQRDPDLAVLSKENGILYHTYPFAKGQKTGVYCDQRENRKMIATYCRDKRVLDLCCFHGGFSLNAVVNGGASLAVGVDSSPDAITICKENALLNHVSEDRVRFVQSDITEFLQETAAAGQEDYDIVVLDPPKLAPSASALEKARRKYHGLNRDAMKVVSRQRGGLLLSCTCSAAMAQKDGGQYFLHTVQGASLAAGRQITLLRVSGAASCHTQSPIAWPAGAYLTAALFWVHPVSLL